MLLAACGEVSGPDADTGSREETQQVSTVESTEPSEAVKESEVPVVKEEPQEAFKVDFTEGRPSNYEVADGWCNGSMFNVTWRKTNVTFKDGRMQLVIDKDVTPANGVPYSGGEFRSRKFYGYGRYEVSMKAIKNDGVVASFFTYTGPSDNNPWDEIDIEILGKDPTKVQFNYFTNGKGEHEYVYELGYDASQEFHTYAFEWYKDKIIWFVDGTEVHRATESIPVTRGKIMMNAWCGTGVDGWLKAFDDANVPLTAEYQWFSFTPFE
ncbi:MAG: glycoside hydrolase family 16 protein [Lachnospiraceae bacterium]|nr:glycoside hydrolase family 16 protein [Lachnospiraceae bacterium]